MISRGYAGHMPDAWHASGRATAGQWAAAAPVPVAAAMVAVAAVLL
jgi:cobalt/nickel transport system permease protein